MPTFTELRTLSSELFVKERERLFLWMPVIIGFGVALYFAPADTPPLFPAFAVFIAGFALALGFWRRSFLGRSAGVALMLVAAGFMAAAYQTARVAAPVLPEDTHVMPIEGRIAEIEIQPEAMRLLLTDLALPETTPEATPRFVRVSLRGIDETLHTGQRVRLRAGLFPPSPPALPGAFDFARHFYFLQIGAVGFALKPVEVLENTPPETLAARWRETVATFRLHVTQAIQAGLPAPAGAIAAALVTGETSAIPPGIIEDMRTSGLYHLLAVSGMNLALVSGIMFFAVRGLVLLVPWVAFRLNPKRTAALAALLGCAVYLVIAGSPPSAERAFVMVFFLFSAMLLNREAMPMRSLALAAALILLCDPASLFNAGFQLSFVATLALIAAFEGAHEWLHHPKFSWRVVRYGLGVGLTAVVAGFATTPFIIHHFGQFASWGVFANIFADALIAFWVMPLVVLYVLLLPLGLGGWVAVLLDYGLRAMVWIAGWFAALPGASIHLPPMEEWGFALSAFGMVWLCLWSTRLRFAGIALLLAGLATIGWHAPYDVLISGDGKRVAVWWSARGAYAMASGMPDSFDARQWNQRAGAAVAFSRKEAVVDEASGLTCDRSGCLYRAKSGSLAAFPRTMEAMVEDCTQAALLLEPEKLPVPEGCAAHVITRASLAEGGAHALRALPGGGFSVERVRDGYGKRPWGRAAFLRGAE